MIDLVEILQHWHAGRPKLVLWASLGVDVKTVRKFVSPAEAEGIVPGFQIEVDNGQTHQECRGALGVDVKTAALRSPVRRRARFG